MNTVFHLNVFHVDKQGLSFDHHRVAVMLDHDTGGVSTVLPHHFSQVTGCDSVLSAQTAAELASKYAAIAEQCQVALLGEGSPCIEVGVPLDGSVALFLDFGRMLGGEKMWSAAFEYSRLISDTPEHRAKLTAIVDSIAVARELLEGLMRAEDPSAYLMAIDFGNTAPAAAASEEATVKQASLPFDEGEEL